MITFTLAGDESGDVSFSFNKGASRFFVVAVIATTDPEGLRNLLGDLRRDSGLPYDFEFKFHNLTSSNLLKRTFATLAKAAFDSWAIVVDKTILPDTFKLMSGLDFYLYFVTELLRVIPEDNRKGATLILDEFGSSRQTKLELRKILRLRGIKPYFKRIHIKKSGSEPLIQIADLVAGSVQHRDSRRGAEAFDMINKKLSNVLVFRP